jgi:RND family efflux transporter MFP subunit
MSVALSAGMKSRHMVTCLGLVGAVAIAGVAGLTGARRLHVTAAAAATVAPPPAPARAKVHADGRVVTRAGGQATLSAELSGQVVQVNVVEGQAVKAGDVLAVFDHREYDAMLAEARGSAGEAYARLKGRKEDLKRTQALLKSGAVTRVDGDHSREERGAAEGHLLASGGAAARARVMIDKARIVAPFDGVVISRLVQPAETVSVGAPLFVVADLSSRRVEAEVDEYDIGKVASGAAAVITADGFPGESFAGAVQEIPAVVAPRKLRPADPARPTDSAVLLVKVSLPEVSPLKLGQRVNVVFETGETSSLGESASRLP